MIRLNQTASQFLSLITAQNGANVVVNYSDDSATGYAGDSQMTNIATATTTTICSIPAASTIRDIDHISIHNTFSGNHAITLQVSSSGTLYPLHTFTLSSGDSFEYTHGSGWKVIDSNGATKSSGVFSSTTPLMNGVASVGTETAASRGDHVHPSDTSRESIANKDIAGGYVGKDANSNLAINNANLGFTSIATAAGTTTLTVSSTYQQYFTGTTTQTVVMPLLSTLALGQAYLLDNDSTGIVTVNANASDAGTATQLPLLLKNGEFARISKKSTTEWSVDISAKRGGDLGQTFAGSNFYAGTTLAGWGAGWNAFQLQNAVMAGAPGAMSIGQNFYNDGTNYRYIANGAASILQFVSNTVALYQYSSGTAGGILPAASTTTTFAFGSPITTNNGFLSSNFLYGIGYGTGAGGTVTQATSRTTGVTLSKVSGAITLVSAAGSTTPTTFTVTNTAIAATDTPIVVQKSGTDLYIIHVTAVAAGSFNITFWTTGGTTTEQPVFNFNIIKGVAA